MSLRLRIRRWICAFIVCIVVGYFAVFGWKSTEKFIPLIVETLQIEKTSMAGDFMKTLHPNNESYCGWRYGLPRQLEYSTLSVAGSPESGLLGEHGVLYDAIMGDKGDVKGVTYCTHTTTEYIEYIAELLRAWNGAISLAVFVPASDIKALVRDLERVCVCLPQATRLSVHFVFPHIMPPKLESSNETNIECPLTPFEAKISKRISLGLSYPVNVCRNTARRAAGTSFVLVSDVELIPSQGLAERLKEFVARHPIPFPPAPPRVLVLPVWELESNVAIPIPRTKTELVNLVANEKAGYFHRRECAHCQRFPGLMRWLGAPDPGRRIRAFAVTRRHFPYHRWEPIYVGTDADPLYSEALSWEGRQDKMTQMLEMCLIGYRLVILDGGFLIHWPVRNRQVVANATKRRAENARHYRRIVDSLLRKYPSNDACRP